MLRSVVSWGGRAVPRVASLELGEISRERRCERESCCLISGGSPVHGSDATLPVAVRWKYDLPIMIPEHEGLTGPRPATLTT